jgi:hypothetical protein
LSHQKFLNVKKAHSASFDRDHHTGAAEINFAFTKLIDGSLYIAQNSFQRELEAT